MDLSPLRKWEILGPDAERADAARGHARHPPARRRPGRLHGDVQRDRRDDRRRDRVPARRRTTSASSAATSTTACTSSQLAEREDLRVWIKPTTDQLHNLAVQGPLSRDILQRDHLVGAGTQPQLEELRWFRFLIGRIGAYDGIPVVVSRTGYSGELGYEVFCHPSDGPAVWDAIMAAGAPHGLKPLGLDALDMLRIESGLIFAGYEFDDQVDPFEAGIGFTVALDARGRLRRQGGADRAQGAPAAARWSGSSWRATRPPATATACTSRARARRSA